MKTIYVVVKVGTVALNAEQGYNPIAGSRFIGIRSNMSVVKQAQSQQSLSVRY